MARDLGPAALAEMDRNAMAYRELALSHGADPDSNDFKVGWYLAIAGALSFLSDERISEREPESSVVCEAMLLAGFWREVGL